MPKPHLISVVVSTYNRPDALQASVESLFSQTDRDFEIIVADDGSGPATRACVEQLMARAPVPLTHAWQEDTGFRLARVRNLGIHLARGEYFLFLDGDCVVQRDFVAQHRRLAERGFMVTGSRVLLNEAFTRRVLEQHIDLQALTLGQHIGAWLTGGIMKLFQLYMRLPDIGRRRTRFSFRRIKGCNLAAWRDDLARINGFDESFTGWGYEDSDFVARLHNAGIHRKDGACATEIFHLWHREAARDRARSNEQIVFDRLQSGETQAAVGLAAHDLGTSASCGP
jgi:glycosyltransferase involved in cell wall biosynthesis